MSDPCCNPTPCCDSCNKDRRKNIWVEGVVDPMTGQGGICMLDQLTLEEIGETLAANPFARMDLPKVTDIPEILALLDKYPLKGTGLNTSETIENLLNPGPGGHYSVYHGKWTDK